MHDENRSTSKGFRWTQLAAEADSVCGTVASIATKPTDAQQISLASERTHPRQGWCSRSTSVAYEIQIPITMYQSNSNTVRSPHWPGVYIRWTRLDRVDGSLSSPNPIPAVQCLSFLQRSTSSSSVRASPRAPPWTHAFTMIRTGCALLSKPFRCGGRALTDGAWTVVSICSLPS